MVRRIADGNVRIKNTSPYMVKITQCKAFDEASIAITELVVRKATDTRYLDLITFLDVKRCHTYSGYAEDTRSVGGGFLSQVLDKFKKRWWGMATILVC